MFQLINADVALAVERIHGKDEVVGSNPTISSIKTALGLFYFLLGVAQFGSALEWGSRGRKFKSSHSDQEYLKKAKSNKFFAFFSIFAKWQRY